MFLDTCDKTECFGCEACKQICSRDAIFMQEDDDGFRYPVIDTEKCIECNLCKTVCPYNSSVSEFKSDQSAFGGYHLDTDIRYESTSGGAFSAIVDAFCDENYVVFGAESKGLQVFHNYITDKSDIGKFRKSKYSQSNIGSSYRFAASFLKEKKKVLFSGTPCQIAGLIEYLKTTNTDTSKLLTVEVICEGIPSPLYIRKLDDYFASKYGHRIDSLDYRFTGKSVLKNGKWDFEGMRIDLGNRVLVKDRWLNPFWSVWLQHLISRPSCYECPFAQKARVADLTLGDLWGVHLYCPELYGHNFGSSLVICNSDRGKNIFSIAQRYMFGHELDLDDVVKHQSPLRKTIERNAKRDDCISDLKSIMDYKEFVRKWAGKSSIKLIIQKYIWGNRQKVFVWTLKNKVK